MIVVIVESQIVRQPSFAVYPSSAGIQSLRAVSPVQRRKYANRVRRSARPIQPEVNVVQVAPPVSPAPTYSAAGSDLKVRKGTCARTKIVNQAQVDRVGGARARSHIMKILP